MSDRSKHSPEQAIAAAKAAEKEKSQKEANEAAQKSIDTIGQPFHYHSDTEPPETLTPELLAIREQLPFAYIVYNDSKEQKAEKNFFIDKEFLEFISTLNSNYLALFKDFVDEKEIWTPETFHEKMEFFKSNYSLPLSDAEAILALNFLNKEQNPTIEIAQKKVEAWRNLATEWGCPVAVSIISLARGGFNIKEIAPGIPDQQNKDEPNKGLCYDNFEYIKGRNFEDTPTTDEVRFFIPMLVPKSRSKNFDQQTDVIAKIAQTIQQQCPEWNVALSMGEANQIADQILAHYNKTGERILLKNEWARTLTTTAGGHRLDLGYFDADGLHCDDWDDDGPDGDIGVSALGVEEVLGH
jgi:hypothetical protein